MRRRAWWTILVWLVLTCVARGDELAECRRLAPKYNAEAEVILHDGTRVDLLSDELAIEVDKPEAWQQSIGQAVLYAIHTERKPAVILLVRDPATEYRHMVRAALVCGHLGIRLFLEPVAEEGDSR